MGFCQRIPFGSMISTVLVAVGCALFAGGAILGLKESEDFLKRYNQEYDRVRDVKDIVSYTCYGLCAGMALVCFALLLRGFFATSRDDVWGGSSYMSHTNRGRCLNIVLICSTFLLFMCWTGILTIATIPLITTAYMFRTTEEFPISNVLDLKYYLIVPFDTPFLQSQIPGLQLRDAHDDIKKEIVVFFVIAWGGALFCVWGLAGFLITLAATWGIGVESQKQEEYIRRRNREQRELEDIARAQNNKYQM